MAFDGVADDFVAGDENRRFDVFVRDLLLETTRLVSREQTVTAFVTANGWSSAAGNCASADGRFVVFTSYADNLVPGDTNGCRDLFVRDLLTGSNRLVSMGVDGSPGNKPSINPTLSADGRYVAFLSNATNLVANDANLDTDIFLRDLEDNVTHLITVDRNGNSAGRVVLAAGEFRLGYSMSADGTKIAFVSSATNLVPDTLSRSLNTYVHGLGSGTTFVVSYPSPSPSPPMYAQQISPSGSHLLLTGNFTFLQDLTTGTLTRVPRGSYAFSQNGRHLVVKAGYMNQPTNTLVTLDVTTGTTNVFSFVTSRGDLRPSRVSDDGRFVVLESDDPRRLDARKVFLFDCRHGSLTEVSANREGTGPPNGAPDSPSLSADGRFVAYRSSASDIVADDDNNRADVFLYDRLTGRTTLASASETGAGSANYASGSPTLSASGNRVVFCSGASDLVPGDFNQMVDVFAYTVTPDEPVDSDGDGLADDWERGCFGDLSHDGTADSDHDSFSDRHEFLAGTEPLNPLSRFACAAQRLVSGEVEVSWPASPGRGYRVQFQDELGPANWNDWSGLVTIVGQRATLVEATTGAAAQRFYRITLVE